ncbi:DUF3857 domain-containing protein [Ohtaekwangia koreensis]|uniref:DUF3857 domain-containing protein n=1 Tax=Ohtaekwangia koreensis TaxID=688867 RepID=A0A1T5LQK8_9BACT|nr:DUF3857 domain-containing protein [Ohtaekwangia koreensis]SKC78296.1 protein of unknown function [Ohtaekwangia koreensis]
MNKKFWAIAGFVLLAVTTLAAEIKPYEWEKNRSRYTLSASEKDLTEIILKQHSQYEYVLEDNQFLMYATTHRIIFVNNTEAIQKHNRIVISMNSTIDLIDLKARAINKDGKASYFDKSNLKELKEEESGNAYRIFAIEGIELGSEIEYYFTRKMRANLFDRVYMQFDAPVKASSFLLTCPSHLKFDFKAYQGFPEVKQEQNDNKELNQYIAVMKDVPAMKKEAFSYFDANRKRIEFKLAYNTARSQSRLYTWDEAAKTFYSLLFTTSKDDDKALEKFFKTLGDDASKATELRIKNIEQKVKTTVNVNRERSEESLSQVSSVIKNKIASRDGMAKLFIKTFEKAGIKCYPVITCSREQLKFDGSFDSWSYLDDYILYFPDTKGFLAPYVFETRYPLIPAEFTATRGLFIEPFAVGEMKSALASVEDIPAADYQLSSDNLDMDVSFANDLSSTTIKQKREFGGYNAMFFAPYYDIMTEEQRTRMIEELTKQTAPDASIVKWSGKSFPEKQAGNFLIDVDFNSSHFLEKAGPRILFKAGELIGPQVEMYRDDQRVTEVENEFNRGYDRKIKIHIPSGYTVKNPQDLKMDITYKDKDKTPFLFQSDYTLSDNVLEITIKEYYKEIFAPLARYEDFRKVINASADFNKVTLVLEKNK